MPCVGGKQDQAPHFGLYGPADRRAVFKVGLPERNPALLVRPIRHGLRQPHIITGADPALPVQVICVIAAIRQA